MQRTYGVNLLLAQQELQKLKSNVISSHDIIPATELPCIYPDEMETYIARFGHEKMGIQIEYFRKLEQVRTAAGDLLQGEWKRKPSPVSMSSIATTMCGVGECQETSNRAAIELIGAGCQSLVNIVTIEGKTHQKPDGTAPYMHAFVVIGDCSPLFNGRASLDAFARLSDECVLLDAFLNITGRANQLQALLKEYIQVYGMHQVSDHYAEIDPAKVDFPARMRDAAAFAGVIKAHLAAKKTDQVDLTNGIGLASFMFFAATNPTANCFKQLYIACKNVTGGEDIYAAVSRTQYAQALRKACAMGALEVVRLLMANRSTLDDFDVNETSSNGRTALDWLELAKVDESVRREIRALIIPAPGKGMNAPTGN